MATDITVTTTTYQDSDRRWLLFEASGTVGPVPRSSGTINYALFTVTNGFIPSGTFLGKVTSGGKLGPYDDAASDGRQTCVGILFNNEIVPADTAQVASVPFIDCFAVVSIAKLPASSGTDANGRADLSKIVFRA